jgi:hypothetical protein
MVEDIFHVGKRSFRIVREQRDTRQAGLRFRCRVALAHLAVHVEGFLAGGGRFGQLSECSQGVAQLAQTAAALSRQSARGCARMVRTGGPATAGCLPRTATTLDYRLYQVGVQLPGGDGGNRLAQTGDL